MKQNIVRILIVGLILGSVFGSAIPVVSARCDPASQICKEYMVVKNICDINPHVCAPVEELELQWPPDCLSCGSIVIDLRESVVDSIPAQVEISAIR